MATNFLTQLIEFSFDADLAEAGFTDFVAVPVYGPKFDVYNFTSINDPAFHGKARANASRFGAAWAEFGFYVELGGFKTAQTTPDTIYDPPFWGRICEALGMQKIGDSSIAKWDYTVTDKIHLSTDTVHTGEYLRPLTSVQNIDGFYTAIENGVMDGTFSLDIKEGPPRLTINSYKGNIYKNGSNYYIHPVNTKPAGIPTITEYNPPVPKDCANSTITITVTPNDGTYTPVVISDVCLQRWEHSIGNKIVQQNCMHAKYKLGQFLITEQDSNKAKLTVSVQDPGTIASPASFNPYKMAANRDMLTVSVVHNAGVSQQTLTFTCDYYISEATKLKDSDGVLEYELTLAQANVKPGGADADYFRVSCS